MSKSAYVEYVVSDLLKGLPGVTARAMFGGYGVYKDGIIFAIIVNEQLYYKVDDSNVAQYKKRGSEPFIYQSPKGPMPMSYWLLPDDIVENPRLAAQWAEQSFEISKKSKKDKKKKR